MPLHRIYAPLSRLTQADKVALSKTITAVYTSKSPNPFPPFYVDICFVDVTEDNFFIGTETYAERAKSSAPFVRIVVEHLARHVDDPVERKNVLNRVENAYKEVLAPRGFEWELTIAEPPQDFWRINGIDPPVVGDKDLKAWTEANRSLPRTS